MPQERPQSRTSVSALQAENKRLQAENAELKKHAQSKSVSAVKSKRFWHKFGIIFFVSLAGALLVVGSLFLGGQYTCR